MRISTKKLDHFKPKKMPGIATPNQRMVEITRKIYLFVRK